MPVFLGKVPSRKSHTEGGGFKVLVWNQLCVYLNAVVRQHFSFGTFNNLSFCMPECMLDFFAIIKLNTDRLSSLLLYLHQEGLEFRSSLLGPEQFSFTLPGQQQKKQPGPLKNQWGGTTKPDTEHRFISTALHYFRLGLPFLKSSKKPRVQNVFLRFPGAVPVRNMGTCCFN